MGKTKEYLKMSDVFFNGVESDSNCPFIRDSTGYDIAWINYAKCDDRNKAAKYAAHAINSHDELVNQRNELLKALEAYEKFWVIRESELGELSLEARTVRDAGLIVIAKAKGGAA